MTTDTKPSPSEAERILDEWKKIPIDYIPDYKATKFKWTNRDVLSVIEFVLSHERSRPKTKTGRTWKQSRCKKCGYAVAKWEFQNYGGFHSQCANGVKPSSASLCCKKHSVSKDRCLECQDEPAPSGKVRK